MSPCKEEHRDPVTVGQHWVYLLAWAMCLCLFAQKLETKAAEANSWSTYRGSNSRSCYLPVDLPGNLQLIWQHSPSQPPQPAWPAPARGSYWQELSKIAPRVVDDHTFHPVLANDVVLFASSADDTVYCLDVETGKLRWKLTTNGPVRYAPSVHGGSVFVGSDDGHVYCLSLEDGSIRWRKRLGLNDRLIPGNGRLISPWPVRTSVAVVEGIAYVGAGLYPSQGVFAYALDSKNGKALWRKKIDYTAHGYLLISQDRLIIPTGRSTPIVLHRDDGRFLAQLPGTPGSYAVVTDRELLSGRGNDGSLGSADIASHESLVNVSAQHVCVTPEQSYLLGKGKVVAIDLPRYMDLSRQLKEKYALEEKQSANLKKLRKSAKTSAEQIDRIESILRELSKDIRTLESHRESCRLWNVATPIEGCLAASNNFLVLGGSETIEFRDRDDGRLLQEISVHGQVMGIALSENHVVATNDSGEIYCFSNRQSDVPLYASVRSNPEARSNATITKTTSLAVEQLQKSIGSTKGYALVVGLEEDTALLEALCLETDLTIVAVDESPQLVDAVRAKLLALGLYGTRVSVHVAKQGKLPLGDYFANLVISTRVLAGRNEDRWPKEELLRVLRPSGGVAWLDAGKPHTLRPKLDGAGRWTHQYGNTANTATSGDNHIRRDLRLQWFGGPGPVRMVDRHLRAPAPLVADGRIFIGGENSMVCVDSYNGTEYWQLDLPGSQRYSMPYDCGYSTVDADRLAIAVQDSAWLVDARSGQVKEKIPVPSSDKQSEDHWGYLALKKNQLFGTIQKATASRTTPSRDQVDRDYNNNRPVVTGTSLFSMDLPTKTLIWQHNAIVINSTITISEDRVFLVASKDDSLFQHESGRILLDDLLSNGSELVALNAVDGEVLWKKELDPHIAACRNVLYVQSSGDRLILSGSYGRENDSWYRVAVLDANSGDTLWTSEYIKGKPGEFTHGEQVHHPVVLGNRLVCEPVIYELDSGRRIAPGGNPAEWTLTRPGHSCGTMSGAGDCLFFRSGNPTVMDLSSGLQEHERIRKISPTRPGCWINIIPADGLVLIPEASASCVCHYSLQTSMAFQPVPEEAGTDQ